jgi:hypothetical protein
MSEIGGKCKRWFERGFTFIARADGEPSIFCHASEMADVWSWRDDLGEQIVRLERLAEAPQVSGPPVRRPAWKDPAGAMEARPLFYPHPL